MEHAEKMAWLAGWCSANGLTLDLEGECGFGRECVGIGVDEEWVDYDTYAIIDGHVRDLPGQGALAPGADAPDAYHKHACLAVLGRGEPAAAQLYAWVRRLADAGATIERDVPKDIVDAGAFFFGKTTRTRIVLPATEPAAV